MKKLLLISSAFAGFTFNAQAQITITGPDLPVIGDQFINILELNMGGISPGTPGEDQVYDISAFGNSGEDSIFFVDPAQTPYASSFDNSSIARFTSNDSSYIFFNVTSNVFEINGMVMDSPFGEGKMITVANTPLTQIALPTTYQTTFDDISVMNTNSVYFHQEISADPYTYFDSVRATITITRLSEVDGWGTLITPFGSSFSVLRQAVTDITQYAPEFYTIMVDTVFGSPMTFHLGWQAIPGAEYTDTTTTYYYLANNNGNPVVLAEIQENPNGTVLSATYAKLPMAAIEELGQQISDLFVFPNPSSDKIEVKSTLRIEQIQLIAADGKSISTQQPNAKNAAIDLSACTAGIYTLVVDTEKGREFKQVHKL